MTEASNSRRRSASDHGADANPLSAPGSSLRTPGVEVPRTTKPNGRSRPPKGPPHTPDKYHYPEFGCLSLTPRTLRTLGVEVPRSTIRTFLN